MTSPLGGARSIQLSYRGNGLHIVAPRTDRQKSQSSHWSRARPPSLTLTRAAHQWRDDCAAEPNAMEIGGTNG